MLTVKSRCLSVVYSACLYLTCNSNYLSGGYKYNQFTNCVCLTRGSLSGPDGIALHGSLEAGGP